MSWKCVMTLDPQRRLVGGSEQALVEAIRRAADLRIYTEFHHNEHIDTASANPERILEVAEFGVTYLLDDRWAAGIMSLRQPILLPVGFGPRSSMSFFLYNQDGSQAIARPHLDGVAAPGKPGPSTPDVPPNMPKYHAESSWDLTTNAPATNFVYDFDTFRYCVGDDWREALAHDEQGRPRSGSVEAVIDAFRNGSEIKVAVRNVCADLAGRGAPEHELFVQGGACYYYTEQRLFMTGTHPVVRVKPAIPMRYESRNWDFGWLMLRTDGHTVYRRCDPYTLKFTDIPMRCGIRWFVR